MTSQHTCSYLKNKQIQNKQKTKQNQYVTKLKCSWGKATSLPIYQFWHLLYVLVLFISATAVVVIYLYFIACKCISSSVIVCFHLYDDLHIGWKFCKSICKSNISFVYLDLVNMHLSRTIMSILKNKYAKLFVNARQKQFSPSNKYVIISTEK